jgi:hypothetical protein
MNSGRATSSRRWESGGDWETDPALLDYIVEAWKISVSGSTLVWIMIAVLGGRVSFYSGHAGGTLCEITRRDSGRRSQRRRRRFAAGA